MQGKEKFKSLQCINAFNIQDLAKEGTASSDIKRVISLLNEQ